jgi:hypothetical protein
MFNFWLNSHIGHNISLLDDSFARGVFKLDFFLRNPDKVFWMLLPFFLLGEGTHKIDLFSCCASRGFKPFATQQENFR